MSHQEIKDYIDQKKELQNIIYNTIDNDNDEVCTDLIDYINLQNYQDNKEGLKEFIYLIANISNNHHRHPNFLNKIKQIILLIKDQIKQSFSNFEIFNFFKGNKLIIRLLS